MKAFFEELLQYNFHYNQKIAEVLLEHKDSASEKSMKLFSHIVNAHQVWNKKIRQENLIHKPWDRNPVEESIALNQTNFKESLKILTEFDLEQLIDYSLANGRQFRHSVRDIMYHIINHSTYHRAQIATEFRSSGLPPLRTDYIYYKMTNDKA